MTDAGAARPLSERFAKALRVANEWHGDHVRKGTTIPYVSHLLGVCSLVLEHGGDEDEATGPSGQGGAP